SRCFLVIPLNSTPSSRTFYLTKDEGSGGLSYQPYKELHREKLTASADKSRRSEGGSEARAIDDHDPIHQNCVADLRALVPCHCNYHFWFFVGALFKRSIP